MLELANVLSVIVLAIIAIGFIASITLHIVMETSKRLVRIEKLITSLGADPSETTKRNIRMDVNRQVQMLTQVEYDVLARASAEGQEIQRKKTTP